MLKIFFIYYFMFLFIMVVCILFDLKGFNDTIIYVEEKNNIDKKMLITLMVFSFFFSPILYPLIKISRLLK